MLSQVLVRVTLCWQWVLVAIAAADDLASVGVWLADLQLEQLTLRWALDQLSLDLVACADSCGSNLIKVWH